MLLRRDVKSPDPFFTKMLSLIMQGRISPVALEESALPSGLPVCDTDEPPLSVRASFGYVDGTFGNEARVVLLDQNDQEIETVVTVPAQMLPIHYRQSGVGVAWISRRYQGGTRGRFEPASTLEWPPRNSESAFSQ
jgi:hypothetical protein